MSDKVGDTATGTNSSSSASLSEADAPISSLLEDLLNRKDFAVDIANVVRNWESEQSIVLALDGDWGEGKTSVKNMLVEALQHDIKSVDQLEDQDIRNTLRGEADTSRTRPWGFRDLPIIRRFCGESRLVILDFSPWQFTGEEQLVRSFLRDLAVKIGQDGGGENAKAIADKLRKYHALLGLGEVTVSLAASVFIVVLAVVSGGFVLGEAALGLDVINLSPGGESFWRQVEKVFSPLLLAAWVAFILFLRKSADYFEAVAEEKSGTIEDLRKELSELLKARKKPVFIIFDDVDRLTPNEILAVFRLVRSNANLPRLVFLLSFYRPRIDEKLESQNIDSSFVDKIVQRILPLPSVPQTRIDDFLFEELKAQELFGSEEVREQYDEDELRNFYESNLRPYFRELRAVNRFCSGLAFQVARLKRGDHLEAHPNDLFLIHVLRQFEQGVYEAVQAAMPYLTLRESGQDQGMTIPDMMNDEEREPQNQREQVLHDVLEKSGRRDTVRYLLARLFPYTANFYHTARNQPRPDEVEWLDKRRVSHYLHFSAYFEQRPSEKALDRDEERELLEVASDSRKLLTALRGFSRGDRLREALESLYALCQEQIDPHNFSQVLNALGKMDSRIKNAQPKTQQEHIGHLTGPVEPPASISQLAEGVLWTLFERIPTCEERTQAIKDTIPTILHHDFAEMRIAAEVRRTGEHPYTGEPVDPTQEESLLEEDELDELRSRVGDFIAGLANGHRTGFDHCERFHRLLFLWWAWGSDQAATKWIKNAFVEESTAMKLIRGYCHEDRRPVGQPAIRVEDGFIRMMDGTNGGDDIRIHVLKCIDSYRDDVSPDDQRLLEAVSERIRLSLEAEDE